MVPIPGKKKIALYYNAEFSYADLAKRLKEILKEYPMVSFAGESYELIDTLCQESLVTDRAITLVWAISEVSDLLDHTNLEYRSYLKTMGRELFYTVAASYTSIYLAAIFLIIANTVMGVQFLMRQQKTGKRY